MATGPVEAHEQLTRFVYEDSYFRRSDNTVKPKAFYPDSDGNCSVMQTTRLDQAGVLGVASAHVTPLRGGKALLAYASVPCHAVLAANVAASYDEPPPNHVNISEYPRDREEMMSRAQIIAAAAKLYRV